MPGRPTRVSWILRLTALLSLAVVLVGCGNKKDAVNLEERSEFEIKLVIETQPAGARMYSADLKSLGESPVEQIFTFEKLTWSNRREVFRAVPNGIRTDIGEEVSVKVSAVVDGYREKEYEVSFPFEGKAGTVKRKISLEK